ncbi:MAG TPA: hypothetical protein VMJ90_08490 [Anaerolineales bacterium]|nr:hypothetical protein [Anaerolineales bacterium]
MKRICSILILLLALTACNAPSPSLLTSDEPTPSPYPDTPSPPRIDAPLIESPALVKIHFVNQLDGWGVTETGTVRTNDGGITWYDVTPSELTEAGYAVDWFVLDNSQVWIQQPDFANFPNGGFQFHTTDGGISWNKYAVPFSGAKLSFLDSNHGWALADLGVGAGSNAVAVYQTNDGGATWNLKYINDPNHPSAGDTLPLGGLKHGLTPIDMKTAWVYGVVYAPGTTYIFRTDDAGSTWVPVNLSLPQGYEDGEFSIEQLQFVSAIDAYLIVRATADQVNTAVYVSSDAGSTWSLTPTLIPGGAVAEFLQTGEVILYNREQFYVTHDAARTWSIIPPDVRFNDTFAAMDFLTAFTGYVLTLDPANHRSLYRTDDGGGTWFPVVP